MHIVTFHFLFWLLNNPEFHRLKKLSYIIISFGWDLGFTKANKTTLPQPPSPWHVDPITTKIALLSLHVDQIEFRAGSVLHSVYPPGDKLKLDK